MSIGKKGILLMLAMQVMVVHAKKSPCPSYCFQSRPPLIPPSQWQDYNPASQGGSLGWLGKAIRDMVQLNVNLFSFKTLKTLSIFSPAYAGSRMIDENIQHHFFSHCNHHNINQFPHWCHTAVRFGIGLPIAIFGSQLFLSKDPEWREAAWFLLLGLPFVIFGKDLIKKIETESCLRPWHEKFCEHHKRACGGFPSGHMAEATYITALYGMRFGPKVAIPLGIYAITLGVVFVNCNRHYFSQLVAGAALGTIYAFAANKSIDNNIEKAFNYHFNVNEKGASIGCSYRF